MPSRTATQSQPLYDDDTDEDYKDGSDSQPTPAGRHGLKKRLSESHLSSKDVSRADRRQQTKNLNDDIAEKRSRRKSMKPSSDFPPSDGVDLDHASNEEQGRSGVVAKPKDARTQLTAVENSETINVPIDVMSSNFEEWMKMATDNVRISLNLYYFTSTKR
jgi:condensin complex subunit 2